ncbi:MAG: hypothetical protein J6F30_03090 [Cellulosilyticum sp.]|nr:hypothetical protein [Cellulosilyticum sp.]
MKFNTEAYDKCFPREEVKEKTDSAVEDFTEDDVLDEPDDSGENGGDE